MSRAPIRTIGSGSARPFRARVDVRRRHERGKLGQRARAGDRRRLALSAATAASSAPASAWSVHAAWNASAYFWKPLRLGPCQLSIAAAAHSADLVGVAVVAGVGSAELCRTDQVAECGNCDRAADRPPYRCAPAYGRRRRRAAGSTPSWRWCVADAYLSDAWHCRQTPSPGSRSLALCGSWQSLQVTPAANILLCLNEP